jgi:endonuclease III
VKRKVAAPPRGRLFQESLKRRPFWMLVACCLVNCTTWEKARHAHAYLMRSYTIKKLAGMAQVDDRVYRVIEHLGFGSQRTEKIIGMARAWLERRPTRAQEVYDLPGCGKYAADSWAIFIDGRRDVSPNDGKLNWFLLNEETRDATDTERGHRARKGDRRGLRLNGRREGRRARAAA